MNPPPKFHIRIRFAEAGKIRFVSHRDVARLFERALRKVRLPVAYSEGFSPRPKLSFGLALSVGHESDAEYLDVELTEQIEIEDLADRLTEALPDGLVVHEVAHREHGSDSLQQAIVSCNWRISLQGAPTAAVEAAVAEALAAEELVIERVRKGKPVIANVRPAILELRVVGSDGSEPSDSPTAGDTLLEAELSTQGTSLRPAELVAALAARSGHEGLVESRVWRTHQWLIVDGVRREPLRPPEPTRRDLHSCPNRTRASQLPSTELQRSLVEN